MDGFAKSRVICAVIFKESHQISYPLLFKKKKQNHALVHIHHLFRPTVQITYSFIFSKFNSVPSFACYTDNIGNLLFFVYYDIIILTQLQLEILILDKRKAISIIIFHSSPNLTPIKTSSCTVYGFIDSAKIDRQFSLVMINFV